MTAFLTTFRRFQTTFRRFSMILQNLSESQANLPNIFGEIPKISEDCQRLPKTFNEDSKMFRSYGIEFKNTLRDKLDIIEIINIYTKLGYGKYATRVPDVVSYECYEWCISE